MNGPGSRSFRRIAGTIAGALVAALIAVPAASAATTPFVDIHSSGPLSDIYIGNDLGCQVRNGGFSSTEFFPNASGPGDCGTFINTGSDDNTEELEGPDFGNHAGGTHTSFTLSEVPFTPVSQTLTGSGTATNPYQVTTVVTSSDADSLNPPIVYQLTEVDTYVVGNDFYRTDVTVKNIGSGSTGALQTLYHAADCQLRGSNAGFGITEPPLGALVAGVACSVSATETNNQPLEELTPITPTGASFTETTVPAIWTDLSGSTFPTPDCCTSNTDNATGIGWTFDGLAPGNSMTFSWNTVISDTAPAGGFSFTGAAGATVGGTVATITDPNTSATSSAYSATINWGDGTITPGTVSGSNGSFAVTGNHAYTTGGQFPVAVTITSVGTSQGSSTVTDTATITATPATVLTGVPSVTATGAAFSGSANPNGLPTTASFQYGLDPKYSGGGPVVYTNSTPALSVGSDFASHVVTTSVGNLVPNALYHVRLVATNSAGTTFGPDVTFTTAKAPAPGSPALGKTVNISLVSGLVLVKIHGVFVPLTELTQIPTNTEINALKGSIKLITAINGGTHPASDAAAKGKKPKPKPKPKTQSGTFGGAIFKITQARSGASKGLATLAIVEGAFTGAPSYSLCTKHKAGDPSATAASVKTLQLLHASAHGKFRTKGKYSAATVLGTKWTVADRCDGTLTHDITDSVSVTDFVHHKTITLHAGQSYLAKKP